VSALLLDRMSVDEARRALGLSVGGRRPRLPDEPPPRHEAEILRDAALQLEERWASLRERWGDAVDR